MSKTDSMPLRALMDKPDWREWITRSEVIALLDRLVKLEVIAEAAASHCRVQTKTTRVILMDLLHRLDGDDHRPNPAKGTP